MRKKSINTLLIVLLIFFNFFITKTVIKKDDFPILETENATLRKFALSDSEALSRCYLFDNSVAAAKSYINNCIEKYKKLEPAPWAIIRKQNNKFIGYCGISDYDPNEKKANICYGYTRQITKKIEFEEIIVTILEEALKKIFEWCFKRRNYRHLEITIECPNFVEVILKKLGFNFKPKEKDCHLKVYYISHDKYLKKEVI